MPLVRQNIKPVSADARTLVRLDLTVESLKSLFTGRTMSRRELAQLKPYIARKRYARDYTVAEDKRLRREERELVGSIGAIACGWGGLRFMS